MTIVDELPLRQNHTGYLMNKTVGKVLNLAVIVIDIK